VREQGAMCGVTVCAEPLRVHSKRRFVNIAEHGEVPLSRLRSWVCGWGPWGRARWGRLAGRTLDWARSTTAS